MKNKRQIQISTLIILLFTSLACNQKTRIEQNQSNNEIPQKATTATPISKTDIKPLLDFFSLANKSPNEIEKIYGKPLLVEKKSVQFKEGEFRHYRIFKDIENKLEDLQIDYYKGKSVGIYLNIPEKFQSKSIEETIKLCGLPLNPQEAQVAEIPLDYWWDKPSKALPFNSIHIRKFKDSGLFYSCEAHIKVQ
jgi:hypothetical protein